MKRANDNIQPKAVEVDLPIEAGRPYTRKDLAIETEEHIMDAFNYQMRAFINFPIGAWELPKMDKNKKDEVIATLESLRLKMEKQNELDIFFLPKDLKPVYDN